MMEENHKLALYVAYYLARFNNEALENLHYDSWNTAFDAVSMALNVNKNSIKNWRDEFDPLFENRSGWHQRPMIPSRVRAVQALEGLDELQMREIIIEILTGRIKDDPDVCNMLLQVVAQDDSANKPVGYVSRSVTGNAAERIFMEQFAVFGKPQSGRLFDCRDLGEGYDFRIETSDGDIFVEVKGLAAFSGGVQFTSKEWSQATALGDRYYACIVSGLPKQPKMMFVQNPAMKLDAKKYVYTIIQVSWGISEKQLTELPV